MTYAGTLHEKNVTLCYNDVEVYVRINATTGIASGGFQNVMAEILIDAFLVKFLLHSGYTSDCNGPTFLPTILPIPEDYRSIDFTIWGISISVVHCAIFLREFLCQLRDLFFKWSFVISLACIQMQSGNTCKYPATLTRNNSCRQYMVLLMAMTQSWCNLILPQVFCLRPSCESPTRFRSIWVTSLVVMLIKWRATLKRTWAAAQTGASPDRGESPSYSRLRALTTSGYLTPARGDLIAPVCCWWDWVLECWRIVSGLKLFLIWNNYEKLHCK